MTIITLTHPSLFAAFLCIDYDNGAVNRLEPESTGYEIPDAHEGLVPDAESALSMLSTDALLRFCTEERSEVAEQLLGDAELRSADRLLNLYFNGWEPIDNAE